MKRTVFCLSCMFMTLFISGQAPRAFNYQAILRDPQGIPMALQNVTLQVRIIDETGTEVYSEMHDTITGELGLVNIVIGEGETTADLASVDWSEGPYFLELTINGHLVGTSPLLSVPYALYAEQAGNAFSGDYNDLENRPSIPSKACELENDAGFIAQESDPVFSQSPASKITADDTLRWSTYFSGRYEDLSGAPQALYDFEPDMGDKTLSGLGDPVEASDALSLGYLVELFLNLFSAEEQVGAVRTLFDQGVMVGELEQAGADSAALVGAGLIGQVEDVDGNSYKWVKIGDQKWMAENLRVSRFRDGTPLVYDSVVYGIHWDRHEDVIRWKGQYCWYENDSVAYEPIYGKLYGGVINDSIEICPTGWTVPSILDWSILIDHLGGEEVAGGKLKAVDTLWATPNTGATNVTGFSGLPGGWLSHNSDEYGEAYSFLGLGSSASWKKADSFPCTDWPNDCRGGWLLYNTTAEFVIQYLGEYRSPFCAQSIRCVEESPPYVSKNASVAYTVTDNSAPCEFWVYPGTCYPLEEKGFCVSRSPNPTVDDFTYESQEPIDIEDGHIALREYYIADLTGLQQGTTYYCRAFASNAVGTAYSNEFTFTTMIEQSTAQDYNHNTYNTVKIGDQVWMAENLRSRESWESPRIPPVEDNEEWQQLMPNDSAYCWYNNNSDNAETYGALYTWAAATLDNPYYSNPCGIQGVCPQGYHLPTDEEWQELELFLGMSQSEADDLGLRGTDEGGKLKEEGFVHWNSPNSGATDESGFTAVGNGYRDYYGGGAFDGLKVQGTFWTATESDTEHAVSRILYHDSSRIGRYDSSPKQNGFAVRCVKDRISGL